MTEQPPWFGRLARIRERARADGRIAAESTTEIDETGPAFWVARYEAGTPAEFRGAALSEFDSDPEISGRLRGWAQNPDRNLVLVGPVGTGKTRAAFAALAPVVARTGAAVEFAPVTELISLLDHRRQTATVYLDRLLRVPFLILDDLGTERETAWVTERIYTILNRRRMDGRPVVATSNLAPADLADALGERSYSRLVGGAVGIRFSGHDRRRNGDSDADPS